MKLSMLIGGLLAASAASGATAVDGWYTSVFGGYTYVPENVSVTQGNLFIDGPSYNGGYNAGGRIGYQSNPLRYELEYTYLHADLKEFYINNIRQTNTSGNSLASMVMANVYYDFPDMVPCISPFLGLGIGYAHVESKLESVSPAFGTTYFKGTDNVFTYQASTGLTYNFAENYALNLSYRYAATDRADKLGKVFQAHIGSLGVIYRFDEVSYK